MKEPAAARDERRYLHELEGHFLRRRGSPLLLSPKDWALGVSWFEEGIPLAIVTGAIDEAFDRLAAGEGGRRPRSLSYVRSIIEERWSEAQRSLIPPSIESFEDSALETSRTVEEGAGVSRNSRRAALSTALSIAAEALRNASGHLPPAERGSILDSAAAIDHAAVEMLSASKARQREIDTLLTKIDQRIAAALIAGSSEDEKSLAEREATERLAPHRPHMSQTIYEQTRARAIENRLRERHGIARLSLLLILD